MCRARVVDNGGNTVTTFDMIHYTGFPCGEPKIGKWVGPEHRARVTCTKCREQMKDMVDEKGAPTSTLAAAMSVVSESTHSLLHYEGFPCQPGPGGIGTWTDRRSKVTCTKCAAILQHTLDAMSMPARPSPIHYNGFPCMTDKSQQPGKMWTVYKNTVTCPECRAWLEVHAPDPIDPVGCERQSEEESVYKFKQPTFIPIPTITVSGPIPSKPVQVKESAMFSIGKYALKAIVLLSAFLWVADLYSRNEAKVTASLSWMDDHYQELKEAGITLYNDAKGIERVDEDGEPIRISSDTKRDTLIGAIMGWYAGALVVVRRWGGFFQVVFRHLDCPLEARSIGNVLATWVASPIIAPVAAMVLAVFGISYGSYVGTKAFAVKALKADKPVKKEEA